jgi:hypothetical protein
MYHSLGMENGRLAGALTQDGRVAGVSEAFGGWAMWPKVLVTSDLIFC